MKKRFGASVTMLVALTLGATMLSGLSATGSLSATARQHQQTVAAHAAFVKYMSSHAPMIRGNVSPPAVTTSPGVTESASLNWSGFADTPVATSPSQSVSSVSAQWTVPRVSCINGQYRNQDVFLAQWVGLDGYNSNTVEQLGTATQCYQGVEYYYDWYEMFPNGTVEEGPAQCISNNQNCIEPGDRIQASVISTPDGANNSYALKLTDFSNQQESFDIPSVTCPAATCVNSSAEWIVERPAFAVAGFQILPQADYGQTAFYDGTVGVGSARPTSIDRYNGAVNDIWMIDDSLSYVLSCPGQQGPPGQLLTLPLSEQGTGNIANSPCGPTNAWGGNFPVTWDASF
jgi:hypothetical protein